METFTEHTRSAHAFSSTKNKGESWEKQGRAQTYHCCRYRARWQLSWALKNQYAITPQKNKCERSKEAIVFWTGRGGGHLLFRAFPNLKSKPKILVLGFRLPNLFWARMSHGVHTVQEGTKSNSCLGSAVSWRSHCERRTQFVHLMFGLPMTQPPIWFKFHVTGETCKDLYSHKSFTYCN
jgi:hypothetical protein